MTYVSAFVLPEATSLKDFVGGTQPTWNIDTASFDHSTNSGENTLTNFRMEILLTMETFASYSITMLIPKKLKSGWHN